MVKTMKIGITERGDAALDLTWTSKMKDVDGAILITKNCASNNFLKAVMQFKDKVIVHATITGNGGSFIEPNVPHPSVTVAGLYALAAIIPPQRIVLRVDPIIPNDAGISWIPYLMGNLPRGVNRIRFSIIDNYKHVGDRGLYLPWKGLHAPEHMAAKVVNAFMPYASGGYIESCGEDYKVIPDSWKLGCISIRDLELLGLNYNPIFAVTSKQRYSCKCLSVKTELLTNRKRCGHGCLYCYWKN